MLKELFFTITDNVTKNDIESILNFYFSVKTESEKTLIESALLSFFDATKIKKINFIYKDGDCIAINFNDIFDENLVFVAGIGDCVTYTEHIYNLANLGIFGEILDALPTSIEELKNQKIIALKKEGSRRIQTIDGRYYDDIAWLRKSQNYQDTIARLLPRSYYETLSQTEDIKLREAVSVINRKDRHVQRINEVEAKILEMESIDQVNGINVTDDELWSGLDG